MSMFNSTEILVNLNNKSMLITPGQTSIEEVIQTLCNDYYSGIVNLAILIMILSFTRTFMEWYKKSRQKKEPTWENKIFEKILLYTKMDELFTVILCAYLIFVSIIA